MPSVDDGWMNGMRKAAKNSTFYIIGSAHTLNSCHEAKDPQQMLVKF